MKSQQKVKSQKRIKSLAGVTAPQISGKIDEQIRSSNAMLKLLSKGFKGPNFTKKKTSRKRNRQSNKLNKTTKG